MTLRPRLRRGAVAAGQLLATLVGVSVLIWSILPLAPGDPARRVLQSQGVDQPLEVAALRRDLGLDRPLPVQYLQWAGRTARGDLSDSYRTRRPVREELSSRLPATALLAGASLLVAVTVTIPLGVVAAAFAHRWPDALLRLVSLVKAAVPSFVFALLLLQYVVVGRGIGRAVLSDGRVADVWMPALALGLGIAAPWSRVLRSGLLEALSSPYALAVRARGASRWRVLLVHALPNAAVPMLNLVGLTVGALLSGAVVIESIFSWPGIGKYVVDSVGARDLPAIQGFAVMATLIYVVVSRTVDAMARGIDPRLGRVAA